MCLCVCSCACASLCLLVCEFVCVRVDRVYNFVCVCVNVCHTSCTVLVALCLLLLFSFFAFPPNQIHLKRVLGDDWVKYRLQLCTARRILDRVAAAEPREPMLYAHALERLASIELQRGKGMVVSAIKCARVTWCVCGKN